MFQRILVVRLSSLGDVVLTGPVYKSLKAHWPNSHICALVKPQYVPILQGHPGVDEVIPYRGLRETLALIHAQGFTHLLDLHATPRSWLLRQLSGIARQSVYRKDALARRLFVAFGFPSPSLQRHTVDRYLEALAPWGVPPVNRSVTPSDWGLPEKAATARRVLVLQTSFLGDSLLTLPLLRRLKERLPGARLAILTLPQHEALFRGSPWVDDILLDDKRGDHRGLLGLWRQVRALKPYNFDLAIIPHRSLRSALLAWLARIPRRIGFAASAGRFLLTDVIPFAWLSHDLERNLALARPLGASVAPTAEENRYIIPRPLPAALARRLADAGISSADRLIGVHPGATWPTKRWLPERFAELCRRLRGEGLRVILVGGSGDSPLGAGIASVSGALDLTGGTGLEDLSCLMGRLSLFVTNDSGPMHLAAAAGVPVVAIFGATTRELGFFPYGPGHQVVEAALACRPCGLHGTRTCPEGHFLCMRLIGVEQVHAACREALKATVTA